ncbi:hypothetical protein BMS3Abin05_00961 [bacterium BMS3Abin05]|nr:hypothetical protein BMS3Abin05_00961 [bacterium BMS3Abin05]GBE27267.1 hypothetical protein BMS3Bbin03_01191 [bacterium BMS3Bbin03]HDK35995.1 hypothetical protein [Bacteroidota bacterium]HDL78861.1 hypothetical protein [Bacteroidota bacterium]HDZ11897.1 hypothetical protein [Bacteroidota bacterium]
MLSKLLLAWDGQWFLKTVQAVGLEKAIEQNTLVRTSFAKIEMREMLRLLGVEKAQNLANAIEIIQQYVVLFGGNRLQTDWAIDGAFHLTIKVRRCPAVEGAKKAGLKRVDQPCVACQHLWPAWLSVLLPEKHWNCTILASIGRGADTCHIEVGTK